MAPGVRSNSRTSRPPLFKWAEDVGLPPLIVSTIRERGLVPDSFERVKAFRAAYEASSSPPVIQPSKLAAVSVRGGIIKGLPAIPPIALGAPRAKQWPSNGGASPKKPPAEPPATASARKPSVKGKGASKPAENSTSDTLVAKIHALSTELEALKAKSTAPQTAGETEVEECMAMPLQTKRTP